MSAESTVRIGLLLYVLGLLAALLVALWPERSTVAN